MAGVASSYMLYTAVGVQKGLVSKIDVLESSILQALDAQTRINVRNMAERGTVSDAQIANSTVAQIQAEGALATWKQGEDVTQAMKELRDKLVQPLITCLSIAGGLEVPRAERTAAAAAAAGAKGDRTTMFRQAEPLRSHAANYDHVMQSFCSKADVDRGRCTKVADASIANGDIRSGLLFGDEKGGVTRDNKQEKAVQAVIERLAGVRHIPPPLPNPSSEGNTAGKTYEETRRDYAAISQLASTSLQRIRMNHRAQAGVGASLKSAGIANNVADDVSMAEAAKMYIDAVLSPEAVKDLAGATDPLPLLRHLVQADSFDLWFQFQQLQSQMRVSALQAAMLQIEAKDTLHDKASTQYENARLVSGK